MKNEEEVKKLGYGLVLWSTGIGRILNVFFKKFPKQQ
jgi:hypothetical protein